MSKYDDIKEVNKFNPYHDNLGRFTSGNGGNVSFFTVQTKDPSKQHWADNAIAREKGKAGAGVSQNTNKYTPAKTVEEAAEYAKTQLGFKTVNYGKADIDTVNMINEQITNIYEQYPEMKGAVRHIENYPKPGVYAAASMDSTGDMSFHVGASMQKGYKAAQEGYENDVKSKFHPPDTDAKAIIWHEFGHLYAYTQAKKASGLGAADIKSPWNYDMSNAQAARKNKTFEKEVLRNASKELKQTQKVTKENISIYATKKVSETFAEAFAEYHCSSNPRKECVAMMKAAGITKKGAGNIDNIQEVK
jgi:GH24 family phage-related lysozyme (muramidase)